MMKDRDSSAPGRTSDAEQMTAGAALMGRLKQFGIDYVFANSGTDFPPVIEGMAEADAKGIDMPTPVIMPTESAGLGMAHGHYLATGKTQAVMVHTNVGLANATMAAINAACDQVPMMLIGGRTPTLEKGRLGARTVPIGWGQEMLDQTALVREACKWDYELRFPEQIQDVVDRARGISESTPKGPVYVSLPREVLCGTVPAAQGDRRPQMARAATAARTEDIAAAARLIADARNPVIFAQRGAGSAEAFEALRQMASDWGIPVCQYWAVRLALDTDHPMAAGPDPEPLLESADVIVVIDALAPWSPAVAEPREDCKVIQLGPDPLQARFGVRNFRADLSLPGETAETLLALKAALDPLFQARAATVTRRAEAVARYNRADWNERKEAARQQAEAPQLTKPAVSAILSEVLEGLDSAVFSELGCMLPFMLRRGHDSWYDAPHSGGLGWGFPAAMGFKLGAPEKTVVATMGDGSYMFSNPVACHQMAEALGLSLVVMVLNNREWGAVRRSVLDIYPEGYAARANTVPLTGLDPSPDFTKVAEASRAWARRVDTRADLKTALAEAIEHTQADRGLALIEVGIRAG